ncbi:MAG: hypothetical protein WB789_08210 [Thermoplasmata archaeon]
MKTAAELYGALRNRGLDLKPDRGRDVALERDLCRAVGCPENGLDEFLRSSKMTAEDLLERILLVVQPFSQMFEEIWSYLAAISATRTTETLTIQLDPTGKTTPVNLESFRKQLNQVKAAFSPVDVKLLTPQILHKFFDLERIIREGLPENTPGPSLGYRRGQRLRLPVPSSGADDFGRVLSWTKRAFQWIIDEYANELEVRNELRTVPELKVTTAPPDTHFASLEDAAQMLTDLVPGWALVFLFASEVAVSPRTEAVTFFDNEIASKIHTARNDKVEWINKTLDVLELPFWKHRWQTYEVWSTIVVLNELAFLGPIPIVNGHRVAIDGYLPGIVASLRSRQYPNACVAVRIRTKPAPGTPYDIQPDLRICSEDPSVPASTVAVVEFKQRARLTKEHVEEVCTKYVGGTPDSGGVLVLNYDDSGVRPNLPPQSVLIEGVHPGNRPALDLVRSNLLDAVSKAKAPLQGLCLVLLLDVSSSMGDAYEKPEVQVALGSAVSDSFVHIYRFNAGLVPGGDLRGSPMSKHLQTSGGTELGKALDDLAREGIAADRLLIVTDGDHDHPKSQLSRIPAVRECEPNEIGAALTWLRGT